MSDNVIVLKVNVEIKKKNAKYLNSHYLNATRHNKNKYG